MNNKTLSQVFLIFLALLLSAFFYFNYFYKGGFEENSKQKIDAYEDSSKKVEGNTIKNILYESYDNKGNKFIIKSETGSFNKEYEDEVYMADVSAEIILDNGNTIILVSDNAKYNAANSNTNFINNVKLEYLDHKVNSDNIDVIFTESKLAAFNNLIYRNSNINLVADKIELDLLTKNTKIFMFDSSKVKIIKD
jgi:hypothetical protein